jgi:hypothetical protein
VSVAVVQSQCQVHQSLSELIQVAMIAEQHTVAVVSVVVEHWTMRCTQRHHSAQAAVAVEQEGAKDSM